MDQRSTLSYPSHIWYPRILQILYLKEWRSSISTKIQSYPQSIAPMDSVWMSLICHWGHSILIPFLLLSPQSQPRQHSGLIRTSLSLTALTRLTLRKPTHSSSFHSFQAVSILRLDLFLNKLCITWVTTAAKITTSMFMLSSAQIWLTKSY